MGPTQMGCVISPTVSCRAHSACTRPPPPGQVLPDFLRGLGLGPAVLTPSRTNGAANILETMKKQTRMLTAPEGHGLPRFPSLLIGAQRLEPQVVGGW